MCVCWGGGGGGVFLSGVVSLSHALLCYRSLSLSFSLSLSLRSRLPLPCDMPDREYVLIREHILIRDASAFAL